MKRLLWLTLLMLVMAASSYAQTTVNLTVTDTPDNQLWNNGTWSVKLQPGAGNLSQTNSFTLLSGGGSLANQSGSLSSTATAAITLPANANIGPTSVWQFTVCSQASAGCFQQSVTVSTSSPQTLAINPPSIRINLATATPPVSAYATGEITGAVVGSQFYLIGTGIQVCTVISGNSCTTWTSSGSAVSSPGVFNSNFDPPLFQNYTLTTTGAQADINLTANPIDTHTISWRPSGTVSTCSIKLQASNDGTYTDGIADAIPAQTCTSAGSITVTGIIANHVRVNLTTLTGGGTLTVVYSGRFAPAPTAGAGGAPTVPTLPCNGYLIKQGDFLIQNSTGNTNGGTFTLTWRMILATGERKEFQQVGLAPSGGNGPTYNSFPLVEGCLVGGSLTLLGGSTDSGQDYAQVFLGRNFSSVPNSSAIQLLGCQISSNYSFGWNGTSPASCRAPTDGQGMNQTGTISNPAAGTNLVNSSLPTALAVGQKHWLANIRFTLTTNATAQARQVCITIKDASANVYWGHCVQGTQAASLIVNYDFSAGVTDQYAGAATLTVIPSTNVAATANEVQCAMPSNLQFSDVSTLSITVIGIQTGDQLSNIVVRSFWSHHVTD